MQEEPEEGAEDFTVHMLDEDWTLEAACRSWPWWWWFPEGVSDEHVDEDGKAVCDECPVRDQCFEWAVLHELYGMWAGTSEAARARLRKSLGIKVTTPGPRTRLRVATEADLEGPDDNDD